MFSRGLLAVVAAALALGLAGCGGGRSALTVYSGRTSNLIGPLLETFSEQTGVAIDVRYGDSAELALLIEEEGDRTPADVFLSQSPGATGYLAGAGQLQALSEDDTARVDPTFRNAAGLWVGVSGRQRVLVYNTDAVPAAELPTSVLALTQPDYAGRVALAPENGSFQDFITAFRESLGDDAAAEWLAGMAANRSPTYANNNAIVEAVGRGEVPMGLVNHYYGYRFLEEDPDLPIANHRFAGDDLGALLIVSTASVVAGTDRSEDAAALIDFLLSSDAQTYFAEETFEYPLAAGVEPAGDVPPLEDGTYLALDFDDLGGGLARTLELIRESGLDG